MNIFLDPSSLFFLPGGIPLYTLKLFQELSRPEFNSRLYTGLATLRSARHQRLQQILADHKITPVITSVPLPGFITRHAPRLGDFLARPHLPPMDIVHATANTPPVWLPRQHRAFVLTIHDLVFFRHPGTGFAHQAYEEWMGKTLRPAAQRADMILTVSEFTKREVVDLLGVPEKKIVVTPIATQWEDATSPIPEEEDTLFLQRRNLASGGYFLSVGQLSPRKNFGTLLEAFEHFRQKQPDARLVIVGRPGWNTQELVRRLETGSPGVTWIQECNSDELRTLYRHARAFFLVSWYEGFGIPLLEAMQCGCPTCYATGSSMDEIAGDAGLAVQPGSAPGITEAMSGLWNNRGLTDDLHDKGLHRATNFSWSRTAAATLEAYRKALAHENRH